MLKFRIIVIDRTRSPFLREAEAFYLERLRKYVHVEWVEVKGAKIKKGRSTAEILAPEGHTIGKRLAPGDYLVPLDRSGHQYSSEGLAAWLNNLSASGPDRISFIIGGPLGLPDEILAQAHEILSLSKLTLTHEMSRLFLLEQLYRAFTIIRGEKYHR